MRFLLMLLAAIVLSCNASSTSKKQPSPTAVPDSINYFSSAGGSEDVEDYTITVTASKIVLRIADKIEKELPYTPEEFAELTASLNKLQHTTNIERYCKTGRQQTLQLFSGNKEVFAGQQVCNEKDFEGGEIDLSGLVPGLEDLIALPDTSKEDQ